MDGFELNTNEAGDKVCGNIDDCKDHQCGEYGVCIDFTGGYTCQCTAGYELIDLGEGHSTCEAVSCGGLDDVEHGQIENKPALLKFPEAVLVICENGYSVDGTAAPNS